MTLDELLLEWSYKSEKGYPSLDSPSDILVLRQILEQLDLPSNEIILKLHEEATTAVEELHEIFVALFVAGANFLSHEELKEIDITEYINPLSLLLDKNKHIEVINSFKDEGELDLPKTYDIYTDAKKLSDVIKSTLDYPNGLINVSRIFPDGPKGKGDIYTTQDKCGYKNRVDISLKYGKGQFNSLSASELMGTFYEIPETDMKRKGTGFLSQIYNIETEDGEKKYENDIDNGVRDYLKFVINNYEKIAGNNKKTLSYLNDPQNKNILDKFDRNLLNTIKWGEWRKIGKNTQNAFKRAFASQPLSGELKKTEYIPSKQSAVNNTIKDFLETYQSKRTQETIIKTLKYILGSDDKNSFFYIGQGGDKLTWIPSVERLSQHEYELEETIQEEDANYRVDIIVKDKKDNLPLFEFDILLRFAAAGGQYTSDITQKGSKFKLYEENFNKVFYETCPS
tara:strand:+ start:1 stop:1362 length:1362 start_codon:yes stop_codon:yes gene_type:complete